MECCEHIYESHCACCINECDKCGQEKKQKFVVKATLTKYYEVEVKATDEADAIAQLDDWIADDFEDFEVGAKWDFKA